MEIEHEVFDIEELFLDGKDNKTPITITVGERNFRAYVTPVTYGEIKQIERGKDENEIADYVLQNHFFKAKDKTPFTVKQLDILPGGVLKGVVDAIMEISGLNISQEDIKTF